MFGHAKKALNYSGMTEEEFRKLKYYIEYCIQFSEGEIKTMDAHYKNGFLKIDGNIYDRVLCKYNCNCFFDTDKMMLTITSTITLPNSDQIYAIDTLRFLGEIVDITSYTADLGEIHFEIPYWENKLKR